MLLSNADVEVPLRVPRGEMREPSAARHRSRDRHQLVVLVCKLRERFAQDLRIRRRGGGLHLTSLRLEFAEPMELVRLLERWRVAASLLRENVQDDRLVLRLQKL